MGGLLVGCPVSHRTWILPRWRDHIEASAALAGLEPEYVFVLDPADETARLVEQMTRTTAVWFADGRENDTRIWDPERYHHMVTIRNELLAAVRQRSPDLFLSIDSDILLHPEALPYMIESLARFDVVGGKTYMTSTGTTCPSWGGFTDQGLRRHDAEGVFAVEIVMAIKLLTPRAYQVDYAYHSHGEDLGFSRNCLSAGLKLGVDARVVNKHVMSPVQLDAYDPRCGF